MAPPFVRLGVTIANLVDTIVPALSSEPSKVSEAFLSKFRLASKNGSSVLPAEVLLAGMVPEDRVTSPFGIVRVLVPTMLDRPNASIFVLSVESRNVGCVITGVVRVLLVSV